MFISLIGTWIQIIAQSWLVFQLTNSAFLLGIVGFLSSIPIFFLSLFGGLVADRMNKRNILIVTQTAFMLLAFCLAILTQFKLITPWQIMLIALLNGVIMAFDAPSRQSVVVELVGRKHLFNAIVLNSVAFNSSRIIGPALAGVLIAIIGMSGCFYVNGISFLAMIFVLFLIRIDTNPKTNRVNNTARDLKEGLLFIKNNRLILILITMVGMVSLFGMGYFMLMPIFANEILKTGVKGLAWLTSSSGIGASLGALLLAALGDFKYKGRLLVASSFVFSVSLVLFSLSKLFLFSLISLVFIGASSVTAIALVNTILQIQVPDMFRGRVMGVFMVIFAGLMPFGNLISGSIAQVLGASFAVMISGITCLIFFAAINIVFSDIRKL